MAFENGRIVVFMTYSENQISAALCSLWGYYLATSQNTAQYKLNPNS
jgi:hypothetical protein